MQYAPYGTVITNTLPVTLTDRLFTGQRFESDLGLYDYRARFYDPLVGSFISADTVVPEVGSPRGWNRYGYGYNNPVKFRDPNGHEPCDNGNWGDCPGAVPGSVSQYPPPPDIGYFQITRDMVEFTWNLAWQWEYTPAIAESCNEAIGFKDKILNEPYDILIIGGNGGFIPPPAGGGPTQGGEIVWNFTSDEFSFFSYDGESIGYGGGASGSVYAGFGWNVKQNADYEGSFNSIDVTFAVPTGSRLIVFWAPVIDKQNISGAELPFGFVIGPAGGAEFSANYSFTEYIEQKKSSWPWPR